MDTRIKTQLTRWAIPTAVAALLLLAHACSATSNGPSHHVGGKDVEYRYFSFQWSPYDSHGLECLWNSCSEDTPTAQLQRLCEEGWTPVGGPSAHNVSQFTYPKAAVLQLMIRPKSEHAYFGINYQTAAEKSGAEVTALPEEPKPSIAKKVGIEVGDVITEFDGWPISDWQELSWHLTAKRAGSRVIIRYTRDGKEMETKVTLGDKRWE